MESKNCVFCYRDVPDVGRSNFNNDDNVSVKNEESQEFPLLKSHMSVILLLRKFLDIPQEMCINLLQDHGDPSSWIYSCEFCKTLVEKAENTFKQLVLINQKFEMLKTELKTAILVSSSSEYILPDRNGSKFEIETGGPTEKVRSYILDKLDKHIQGEESVEIKVERLEFEDIELNSEFSDGQYQHSMEDVNINDCNLPIPVNYIIPEVIKSENDVHVPFDQSSSKVTMKTYKSGRKESVFVGGQPKLRMKTLLRGLVELEGPSRNILHYCSGCGKYEPDRKARSICYQRDRGPYKCSLCPKQFDLNRYLQRHVKTMHPPDPD